MRRFWCLAVLGLAGPLLVPSVRADDPPDLTGYRTVKDAATRAVASAREGQGGQTGYLGVAVVRDTQGRLVVDETQEHSPAAKAGVQKNDVIRRLDGEVLKTTDQFREAVQSHGPGEVVELSLLRGDDTIEKGVTLGSTSRPRVVRGRGPYLGVVLGEGREGEGVRIEEVLPSSPAAAAGLKPGDHLVKIDSTELLSPARLLDFLAEKRPGDSLAMAIRRGTEELILRPMLAADPDAGRTGAATGVTVGRGPIAIEPWKQPVFRVAVIGIEFPDVKHNAKASVGDWRDAFLSTGTYHDKKSPTGEAVHGSLNDYFVEQSQGAFHVEGKVFEWIEVSKKRAEYAPGSGTTNITAVLVEALGKVEARDGKDAFKDVDGFLFLYSGEAVRTNRGGVYYPHAGMIRSFQSKRWPYVFAAEGGPHQTGLGVFVREFGRMLGLPSLAARAENADSEGLGAWCAMSNTSTTNRPQHLSAWSKEKMGWLKSAVIDPTIEQKLILSPIEESSGECFKILVRRDGSEYFLLENRAKKGFDSDLPAEGLLIWRVVKDQPILEEAHGVVGPSGPLMHLSAVPYPSPANHAFTPQTLPSSRSPQGGGLPVWITDIRRLPDGRITFVVGQEYR